MWLQVIAPLFTTFFFAVIIFHVYTKKEDKSNNTKTRAKNESIKKEK